MADKIIKAIAWQKWRKNQILGEKIFVSEAAQTIKIHYAKAKVAPLS